ncbi:MAG TPA: hypothetical protein VKZ63_08235 [Kofleriaceae bacterium]|nr:hypothetical protein [Kofleriaceae bacterium]
MTEAVQRLEEALAAYGKAARRFLGQKMELRGHVARAAEQLGEVAALDERLTAEVAALVGAVTAAREAQQRVAQEVHARALQLLERKEQLEPLVAREQAIASEVAGLAAIAKGEGTVDPASGLTAALVRAGELSEAARELARDARAAGFGDMADDVLAMADRLSAIQREAARRRGRGELPS